MTAPSSIFPVPTHNKHDKEVRVPVYPLIGSVYGNAISNHDGKAGVNIGWCELCARDLEDSRAFGFANRRRSHWEDNPILKEVMAERPEDGCWTAVKKEARVKEYLGDHSTTCKTCTCPRWRWIKQVRTVRVLKPGHMQRLGIPWSKSFAPKGYAGVCMQDVLATFGRRYISPNFWTTNARRAHPFVVQIRRGRWTTTKRGKQQYVCTYKRDIYRNYGDGGFTYCFPSIDASVPFVRAKFREYERKVFHTSMRVDVSQLEAAFYQWIRLRKLPYKGDYDNKEVAYAPQVQH